MGRRTKLTKEVHDLIVRYVREGAYDYVAAEAAGIDQSTFYNWMRWGRKGNPRYVEFFQDVTKAHAEARRMAEVRVRMENPLAWLRYGPGRSTPGRPGWTDGSEITLRGDEDAPLVVIIERDDQDK